MAALQFCQQVVLVQAEAPSSLAEVLKCADGLKRRQVMQRMTMHMTPLMEKALVDAVLTHRCAMCNVHHLQFGFWL